MVTYDDIVKDISDITKILGEYATVFYDLKKNWKGLSYDNLERKAESFRSNNITKINDGLRHLSNAASNYNNYYLKHKNDYKIALRNYNSTDEANTDKSIYKNQMNNALAKQKDSENYIKSQLTEAQSIKVDSATKINYGSGV